MRSALPTNQKRSTARRENIVALYSASVKPVSRSSGRSAVAAAAYRNAERITNERTGEIHDYTRRSGVDHCQSFAPVGMIPQPSAELWNKAEAAEVRSNARVAREVLVALPHELDQVQRRELAQSIAQDLADRYGTAGTLAVHQPDREGDQRNHHVHILMTTRRLDASGQLGEKTRELDDVKRGPQEVEWIRGMIEDQTNRALERAGVESRVDRRSLILQHRTALDAGDIERAALLDRPATAHEGPRVTQIRREAVRAGRAPLGALDRAAANDHCRQLAADRAELGRVSAQIFDFEKARQARLEQDSSIWCGPAPVKAPISAVRPPVQEAVLSRLSWERQGDSDVLYKLDGEAAFIDRGERLDMAIGAGQVDEKVLAALLTARDYYEGSIDLTGSEAFKAKAIALIAQHQIDVTMKNPAHQVQLDEARFITCQEKDALSHELLVAAEMTRQREEAERQYKAQVQAQRAYEIEQQQMRIEALRLYDRNAGREQENAQPVRKPESHATWKPPSPG